MKKNILYLFLLLFSYSPLYSQEQEITQAELPTNYEDSLTLAFKMIDELEMSDLIRQKERFTYKVRIESYQLNAEILAYIEKRINLLSK